MVSLYTLWRLALQPMPTRCLSFHVIFTGEESNCEDWDEGNIHGGAMWARNANYRISCRYSC